LGSIPDSPSGQAIKEEENENNKSKIGGR